MCRLGIGGLLLRPNRRGLGCRDVRDRLFPLLLGRHWGLCLGVPERERENVDERGYIRA